MQLPSMMRVALVAFGWALAAGAPAAAAAGAGEDPIGVLVFGDSGYHLGFMEAEDLEKPLDARAFAIAELDDWLEDNRPLAEFRLPPVGRLANGGHVMASGLMPVAKSMQRWCAAPGRCRFGVMLGDNIYPDGATAGADGRDAERWQTLFVEPFAPLGAGRPDFRIYSVLGNHDWNTSREGALAELGFLARTPPFYIDGLFYRAVPRGLEGRVEVFAIDTTVLLAGHEVTEYLVSPDGTPVADGPDDVDPWTRPRGAERRQLAWLEQALAESTARWKLVIAHHPIWASSSGKHGQTLRMRELLLPALCRYADAFLVGHEHTLELHEDDCRGVPQAAGAPPLPQLVSGAAGKQRPLHTPYMAWQDRSYPQKKTLYAEGMVWGFAHLELRGDEATVRLLRTPVSGDADAELVFEHRIARRSQRAAGAAR